MLQVSWRLQEQQTMHAVRPRPSHISPPPHPSLTQAPAFHSRSRPQTRTYGAVWGLSTAFRFWFCWFWSSWCLCVRVFPRSSPSVSAWQWQRWEGPWWRWAITAHHQRGLHMTWEVTCFLTAARQSSPPPSPQQQVDGFALGQLFNYRAAT